MFFGGFEVIITMAFVVLDDEAGLGSHFWNIIFDLVILLCVCLVSFRLDELTALFFLSFNHFEQKLVGRKYCQLTLSSRRRLDSLTYLHSLVNEVSL